ncbi:MAG: protein kinase [Candidatus Zixiibacteriota bacterium]|nr:MAG: protein kinase [candidate division Zixibacteria bacterium]
MPDDDGTIKWDETAEPGSSDPLGIMGWEIAGKYKIDGYIGGGGFGEVYAGYNKNLLEQRLIFKFFKRVQSRSKFAKEAKILCMLDHPNISRVIDFLPEEGAVVVSFIDGRDGASILKESGAISGDEFLKVARAVTSAIAYAHEKRIAHRDIKPGNIMFDKRGQVYVIDFGIAKEMGGDATKTSYQALTPMFAAPERHSGDQDYNPFLSDIYEIGITLFNFATNDLPYRNPAHPNPQEWGGLASDKLSPELRQILMKATHPEPAKRYKTAAEMYEEFKDLKHAYGGAKKRRSVLPYVAILVVLAVAAYLGRNQLTDLWQQISSSQPAVTDAGVTADSTTTTEEPQEEILDEQAATAEETEPTQTEIRREESKPPVTDVVPEKKPEVTIKEEPVAEKETEIASIPEEETVSEEPISPALIAFSVDIIPTSGAILLVDGNEGSPDSAFSLEQGRHRIGVLHPDYPAFEQSVDVSEEQDGLRIDLGREFSLADSVSLQISLLPASDQHWLALSFNGRGHTLMDFPNLGLQKPKGPWQIEAEILDLSGGEGGKPRIDSLIANPYGGETRAVITGHSGKLTLGAADQPGLENVPLLIFWSKED